LASVTIFHTNDFHNRIDAPKAARLKALKDENPNSLLFDAGDAIWAGNMFVRPGGEPALRLMSAAGYDAMALGNREFHFLASGLRGKLGWAEFPVLCANIRPTKEDVKSQVVPFITKRVSGLRIAVFGLTVPMITEQMLSRKVSAHVFDDPIAVAGKLVPELRAEHDLIVALTHIGLKEDRRLAETVPGIDLIVGGHTHAVLELPEMVNGCAIVQAGWYGHSVGRVDVTVEENAVRVSGRLMELRT
jgi:2',3'-cyclic-nucleotide 2'-phosphodiesterase (5'-nucleotidase family)